MAKINLLPWREELRKKHLQDFLVMILAGLLVTGGVMGGWHWHNENNITHQNNRNNYVKREIVVVDERIREIRELEKTKAQLLSRMNVITQLQSSRPQIVRLMDDLVTTLPEGVFLTKVTQSGSLVSIEGRAQSNARVSSYMRNIEETRWLDNPVLKIIENKDKTGTGFSHFSLTASQKGPKKKDEEQ
jgi:type IV pilus assembly protein PilN